MTSKPGTRRSRRVLDSCRPAEGPARRSLGFGARGLTLERLEPRILLTVDLDNGLLATDPYYFRAVVDAGGNCNTVSYGSVGDAMYRYDAYLEHGSRVYRLGEYASAPTLEDGHAVSTASIAVTGGTISVQIDSWVPQGTQSLISKYTFTGSGGVDLRGARLFQYMDSDIYMSGDDVLQVTGSVASGNLRLTTIDPGTLIQLSQVLGQPLSGAQVAGFAADRFDELRAAITAGGFVVSAAGTIDTSSLPPMDLPGVGPVYGKADTTSAIVYQFTNASSVVVRTTLAASDIAIEVPDLGVTQVIAPAAVRAGDTMLVKWTVKNFSDTAAPAGSWTDSVYLSADDARSADDLFLGAVVHDGGLSAQGFYHATLSASTDAVPAGDYYVIVVTDSGEAVNEGRLEGNNVRASAAPSQLGVAALTPGTPASGAVTAAARSRYFALDVPPGTEHLLLTLDDADNSGVNALYGAFGVPPTRGAYEASAAVPGQADQQLVLSYPAPGRWYFLVYAAGPDGAGSFTLSARTGELAVTSVTPERTADSEPIVVRLSGFGFDATTLVRLIGPAGQQFAPVRSTVESLTEMSAVFAAGTLAPGPYDVRVFEPDGEASTLDDALAVIAGGTPDLKVDLIVPSSMGYHELATLYLEYANLGDAPMRAPLVFVSGYQNGRFAPLLTLDRSRVSAGYWTSGVPEGFANYVQVLASGETPGWLLPGETGRVEIYYAGWQQPWDLSYPPFEYGARVLTTDAATPIDWAAFHDSMRPETISAEAWEPLYTNLVSQIGPTWGDFVRMLGENVEHLAALGETVTDARAILGFEYLQAEGLSPVRSLAAATDAQVDTPGLPLDIGRFFPNTLSSRYYVGTFGRGWVSTWDFHIETRDDGTASLVMPTARRVFQPDLRGGFLSEPGDAGRLSAETGGGWTLREADGTRKVFRSDGLLDYVEDPDGTRITAAWTAGRLTRLTHSTGAWIEFAYNAQGRVSAVRDNLNRTTTLTYDAAGYQLLTATAYDGRVTRYSYNSGAAPAARYALESVTLPDGTRQLYSYDARGRLAEIRQDGAAAGTTLAYDEAGRVTVTDALGNASQVYFNERGLTGMLVDPLGRTSRFSMDSLGNLVGAVGPDGRQAAFAYDLQGRVSTVTDAAGGIVSFSYDPAFNQVSRMVGPDGQPTTWQYDREGHLVSVSNARLETIAYTYNDDGWLSSLTNRRDQTTSFTYDALGRVVQRDYPTETDASYTYDARGNLISMTDATGTTTWSYDAADRLDRVTYPGGLWLDFDYDAAGRRTRQTDQTGYETRYVYDGLGRLSELRDASGTVIVAYAYDAAGRLVRQDGSNGAYTTWQYNAAGQVTLLTNRAAGGAIVSRFGYEYDSAGRLAAMTTLDGRWEYTHDAVGRLTRAVFASDDPARVPNQDLQYEYDAAGNRTRVVANGVETPWSVNDLGQYAAAGGVTYSYDKDGNVLTRTDGTGTTTFTYDSQNRLVGMARGGDTWAFVYNGLGQRVAATHNGVTTRYVIDPAGLGNVAGEYTNAGALIAHYDYGYGLVDRRDAGGTASFYQFDALGNTVALTGAAGTAVNGYRYLPFGEILTAAEAVPNDFEFNGRWGVMSDGNGLLFMRARFYDPQAGRFIQQDPIGILGGLNLYAFAENDPLTTVDPSGLVGQAFLVDALVKTLMQNPTAAYQYLYSAMTLLGYGRDLVWVTLNKQGLEAAIRIASAQISKSAILACAGEAGLDAAAVQGAAVAAEAAAAGGGTAAAAGGAGTANAAGGAASRGVLGTVGAAAATAGAIWGVGTLGAKGIGYVTGSDWWDDVGNAMWSAVTPTGWGVAWNYYFGPSQPVGSRDPNEKLGPAGVGEGRFVAPGQTLAYRINFENDPEASAPAQRVTITDPLAADLDWSSFALTEIGFGDVIIPVPGAAQHFETVQSIAWEGTTFNVQIEAGLDLATGVLNVVFQSLDPDTGLPPAITIGFLPPEDGTGRGLGHVSYLVAAAGNLPTGRRIANIATIQFDYFESIATNQVDPHDPSKGTDPLKEAFVTIDADPPSSSVLPLPAFSPLADFTVAWSGNDGAGSGVAAWDVFVSTDQGPWTLWLDDTAASSAVFNGAMGHSYAFYAAATDRLGLEERKTPAVEASTTVASGTTLLWTDSTKSLVWTESAALGGATVTLNMKGVNGSIYFPGYVTWTDNGRGGLTVTTPGGTLAPPRIDLTGASSNATVGIKTKGGDNLAQIDRLTALASLASLSAKTTDFVGDGISLPGGYIGTLSIHDLVGGADIRMTGAGPAAGITLTLNSVGAGSDIIAPACGIKSLSLADAAGGGLDALWATTVSAKGNKTGAAGDFLMDLVLHGPAPQTGKPVLGSLSVKGALGGQWDIRGDVGKLAAGRIAESLDAAVTGRIASITTLGDAAGSLTALALTTLSVKANLHDAAIHLTQPADPANPKLTALGKVTVGGRMERASIASAGNIGSVTVGKLSGSRLLAGVVPGVPGLPVSADDFDAARLAAIATVSVKGIKGEAYNVVDSVVAAWALGKISLKNVDVASGSAVTGFGLAGNSLSALTYDTGTSTEKAPVVTWTSRNEQWPPADGNFRVIRVTDETA